MGGRLVTPVVRHRKPAPAPAPYQPPGPMPVPPVPAPDFGRFLSLYGDQQTNAAPAGWTDNTFNGTATWNHVSGTGGSGTNTHVGLTSIAVSITSAYGALSFQVPSGGTINLADFDYLSFFALAASGTTVPIQVQLLDGTGTPIGSTVQLGNLPNAGQFTRYDIALDSFAPRGSRTAVAQILFQLNSTGGTNTATYYIDEVCFVKLRSRYLPGCQPRDLYEEIRPADLVSNFWPLMDRAAFPTPFTNLDATFYPYSNLVDGNAAGTTEQLAEWAARKWGFWPGTSSPVKRNSAGAAVNASAVPDIVCPRTSAKNPDTSWIFAGLMEMESYWRHTEFTHWTGLTGPPAASNGYTDVACCQIRTQYEASGWGGFPGTLHSRAFSLDMMGAILRYLFDASGAWTNSSVNPSTADILRCLQVFNMGNTGFCGANDGSEGADSSYVREIMGGTVGNDTCMVPGHVYSVGTVLTGYVVSKHWVSDSSFRTVPGENQRVVL